MDRFQVYCTLLLLISTLTTLSRGLKVKIYGEPKHTVKPGSELSLTCGIDQGVLLILQYKTKWYHVSLADPTSPVETQLTADQQLTDGANPNFFDITAGIGNNDFNYTLILKNVKDKDDGKYKCITSSTSTSEAEDSEVDVVVVSDVKEVKMMFDGEEPITGQDQAGLEREEGEYGVTCTAVGFSPDASIHIFVGDEELETGGTEIVRDLEASKEADARRYRATSTAPRVRLRADQTGQKLRCEAKANFDGAAAVVASVPLTVISLEPEIICYNSSAREGQMYVTITCQVYHAAIEVDKYGWEIGSTGEMIIQGVNNVNYNQIHVEDIDDHTANVTLDLNEVDESHLNTYYYIEVYTKSGQIFREPALLLELDSPAEENPTGKSSQTVAFHVGICILVLLSLLSC